MTIEITPELAQFLESQDRPAEQTAKEFIVLELYRRHEISSGKAAQLLNMDRIDFIYWSGKLGIPFIDMSDEEIADEIETVHRLAKELRSR